LTFDVVGIGTSPLMLMRAVSLAADGRRVLLCDRAALPGGAWTAPSLLGFANVENGVHLLENRPSLLWALEDNLAVAMQAGAGFGLVAGHRLNMAATRVLLQGGAGLKALLRGEADKGRRSFRSALRAAVNLRQDFYYPAEGASAITRALRQRFADEGGQIRFGVEVCAIDVRDGQAWIETSDGWVQAGSALLASRAFAPVSLDGVPQPLSVETGFCHTTVLYVRGEISFEGAYVEILGDQMLKRARDLSQIVRPSPRPGCRVICVQARRPPGVGAREIGENVLERLRRLDLAAADAVVLDAHQVDVAIRTLSDRSLRRLMRRSGGAIEGLRTTDFAEGFVSEFDRLLSPSPARQAGGPVASATISA
jgi:hypothetical protein